jgi:hypothetical protein
LEHFDNESTDKSTVGSTKFSVPYMPVEDIRAFATEVLEGIG